MHVFWQAGLLKTIHIIVAETLQGVSQIWEYRGMYLLLAHHGNLGNTRTAPRCPLGDDTSPDQFRRHTKGPEQDRIWIAPAALLPPRWCLRLLERDTKNLWACQTYDLSLEIEGQAELTIYPSNLCTAFTPGDGNATPLSDSLLGLGFGLKTISLSIIILQLLLASY